MYDVRQVIYLDATQSPGTWLLCGQGDTYRLNHSFDMRARRGRYLMLNAIVPLMRDGSTDRIYIRVRSPCRNPIRLNHLLYSSRLMRHSAFWSSAAMLIASM